MSNTSFSVPILKQNNAWVDMRANYKGGYGWRGDMNLNTIKGVVVHHTVTNKTGDAKKDVDGIYDIHVNKNGWGGIGYHFLITSEIVGDYAKVAYVGDIGSGRAHTPNAKEILGIPANQGNFYMLGFSFVAMNNVAGKQASPEQLRSAYFLIEELVNNENTRLPMLKSWENVVGHGKADETWCPDGNEGTIIIPKIKSYQPNYMNTESQELTDAKAWEQSVEDKYGINLMSKIDATTPLNREHFIMILHRYTMYLNKTNYDDKGVVSGEDVKTMIETATKDVVAKTKKSIKDSL